MNYALSVAMHTGGVLTEMSSAGDLPEAIRKIMIDKAPLPGGTAVYLSTDRVRYSMGWSVLATWDIYGAVKEGAGED